MRSCLAAACAAALIGLGAAVAAAAAPADDLREAQRLYSQGKLPAAADKLDAVLRAQPKDPQARFLRGLILTEQKKTAEAIQVFTSLTEDYPELPEPYNNLAVLYASQGNYDKAKSALELAIHTHPSYATAHENLGDVYAQLASRAYDRALQLDKNNTAAQVKLAMVKDLFSSQKGAPARPAPPRPEPAPAQKAPPPPPPKMEPVSRPEPPKPAPAAKSEPMKAAKAEPPAKGEPMKAAKAEPAAKSEPPMTAKVEPKPASRPAAGAEERTRITAAVEAWARAWSAKDLKGYFAAYAPEFDPGGGQTRAAWEKLRTERIENPKSIEVSVRFVSIDISGNEAKVTFRQSYKSDTLRNTATKTLAMIRSGDRWLIRQERIGG